MTRPAPGLVRALLLALAAIVVLAVPEQAAMAQQNPAESRLREALRQTTQQLRALQDAQAGQQAALDEAKRQRDLLHQTVDQQALRLSELEAKVPDPAEAARREAAIAQLRQDFVAMQADNAALLQALKQWQAAYQEAADVARAKEGERRTLEGQVAWASQTLSLCEAKNDKLLAVANDILDLYQSQDFISVWRGSYEPILGLRKVELQNIVQDYQDRILDQTFVRPEDGKQPAQQPGQAPAQASGTSSPAGPPVR